MPSWPRSMSAVRCVRERDPALGPRRARLGRSCDARRSRPRPRHGAVGARRDRVGGPARPAGVGARAARRRGHGSCAAWPTRAARGRGRDRRARSSGRPASRSSRRTRRSSSSVSTTSPGSRANLGKVLRSRANSRARSRTSRTSGPGCATSRSAWSAIVSAWNFPLGVPLTQAATAVAAGNAVVLKPSELTPLTGRLVEELFRRAGAPAGLVRVVQGAGETVGDALVRQPWDRQDRLHRLDRGRAARCFAGGGAPLPAHARARRQGPDARPRRRRPRPRASRAPCGRRSRTAARCARASSASTSQRELYEPFLDRARRARRVAPDRSRRRRPHRSRARSSPRSSAPRSRRCRRRGRPWRRGRHRRRPPGDRPPRLVPRADRARRRARSAARIRREEIFGPVVTVASDRQRGGRHSAGERLGVRSRRERLDARPRPRASRRRASRRARCG